MPHYGGYGVKVCTDACDPFGARFDSGYSPQVTFMVSFNTKESLAAWAAGLFDGEGTIITSNRRFRVSVHMTDLDVLETFQRNFGGSIINCKKQKKHHKKSWRWYLDSIQAISFLETVLPFLHERRLNKAKETIAGFKIIAAEREEKQRSIQEKRIKIKELAKTGMTRKDISILFNVDRSYVTNVVNGKYGGVRELVDPGCL